MYCIIIHTHSGNHSVYFKSTTEARSGHLNNTEKDNKLSLSGIYVDTDALKISVQV